MEFFHPRWPVFHEDNHVLVLYKPAGLIMQRDRADKINLLDLAKEWIKERYAKPGRVFAGMVHRLDAPVAGVILLARTSKSAGRLSAQFREGRVRKIYLAVVQGCPHPAQGRLVHRLARDGRLNRPATAGDDHARSAALSYRVLESHATASLVEILLETGRRHQIRSQLSAVGCPIMGDRLYGAGQSLADGRIALLAQGISFTHPTANSHMHFQTPLPQGWPWPAARTDEPRPLWTIEEYQREGFAGVLSVKCKV
jgi:23S rRNA pseudouridine1911/1915/1917 synthase